MRNYEDYRCEENFFPDFKDECDEWRQCGLSKPLHNIDLGT